MKRRHYFLLPDLESARRTADELLLARVPDEDMRFLATRGADLAELHEASYLQKSDLVHGAGLGLAIGGLCGLLGGFWAYFWPPTGFGMPLAIIAFSMLGGAVLGAWIASLVGASVPNTQLKAFSAEIERGAILMMLDIPRQRTEEVVELISRRHPEARYGGLEPTAPAFP